MKSQTVTLPIMLVCEMLKRDLAIPPTVDTTTTFMFSENSRGERVISGVQIQYAESAREPRIVEDGQ